MSLTGFNMKSWLLCFVFYISMVVLINGITAKNINEDGAIDQNNCDLHYIA